MSKKKKKIKEPMSDELSALEPVDIPPVFVSDMMRIRIDVGVNGYKSGDLLTVERTDRFFGGLVKQGLAEELS